MRELVDPVNFYDPEGLTALPAGSTQPPPQFAGSSTSAPGVPNPNNYAVYATICIGKRCTTAQVNNTSILGANPLGEIAAAESWYKNQLAIDTLNDDEFKKRFGVTKADAIKKAGSWDAVLGNIDDCFSRTADEYYAGNGGLPSFVLCDDAMKLIDSLLGIVNRTNPTLGTKTEYDELVLILKKAMYDDNPSISTLRSQALDVTKRMFDKDTTDCAKGKFK